MILAQPPVFHFPEYCPGRHLIRMRPSILMRNRRKYNRPQRIRLRGRKYKNLSSRRTKCQRRWRNFVTVAIMKKSSNLSNSFERVLEDEALPKAKQILKLISVHGGALEDFYVRRVAYFLTPVI